MTINLIPSKFLVFSWYGVSWSSFGGSMWYKNQTNKSKTSNDILKQLKNIEACKFKFNNGL